jgi:hypothetical protein
MTSFRCDAVVLWASRKIVEVWVRNSFSGVSLGTSTDGDDILDAGDARELSVCKDDFWETSANVREDLAVATRPGIFGVMYFEYDGWLFILSACKAIRGSRGFERVIVVKSW